MKLKIPQYQLSEVLNMMAFKGISEADIKTMMDLRILREHYYRYNSTIFKAGEITEELGIVIKGRYGREHRGRNCRLPEKECDTYRQGEACRVIP